ncbi:hypothetical protein KMP11_06395 [Gemella sp. zg-570]|uniref:hypothetical protein n=1 Tax=Gemella sp. zg-570 TaxID=2840371 RepID=UPI001C0E705C|nr:hypothetical protein [Gemella sp. zg-570]QWQ38572.1 hypothetical protein KMP11_06395 [Gemella sp. zg-570]
MKKIFISVFALSVLLCASDFSNKNAKAQEVNFLEARDILPNQLKDIVTFPLFQKEDNQAKSPELISNFDDGLSKLELNLQLPTYDKDSYKFLVVYSLDEESKKKEIFRYQVNNSGNLSITDSKILGLIKNNMSLMFRTESFKIKNNKVVEKLYSQDSKYYYTPREYNLTIKEGDKLVYSNNIIFSDYEVEDNKVNLKFSDLKKYSVDRYFSYEASQIKIDGIKNILDNDKLQIPLFAKDIVIDLSRVENQWAKVKITYPSILKENNRNLYIKKGSRFSDFKINNSRELIEVKTDNENYSFLSYRIGSLDFRNYEGVVNDDILVKAIYNTKIKVQNDDLEKEFTLATGDKLSKLDLSDFQKENYNIENYTVIDAETKEEKIATKLDDVVVDNSITIKPNYKEKTYKIMVRQDDYNKRFGSVDASIENKDIEWSATKPIGELLEKLRPNIKASEGYVLEYRVNRKKLNPETLIKEDITLEIYFKKNEEDWVNVKFVGEGIDKFLSDGQEVLAGRRIDTINLPSSQGSSKEFLGWTANLDYKIEVDGKILVRNKDYILKNIDLAHVLTSKGQNLIFNAQYLETYKISLETNGQGEIFVANQDGNVIDCKQGLSIKNMLADNRLLLLANSHFKFSHFTSTLPLTVKSKDGSSRLVKLGEKISLQEFETIVPDKNLTFIAHFVLIGGIEDKDILSNHIYTENILNSSFERDYSNPIYRALGPLNFLK